MAAEQAGQTKAHNNGTNPVFIHSLLDDYGLSPAEFRVYCHIARRAGHGDAYPAIKSISRVCRLHPQTVRRALRTLVKIRLLTRMNRPGQTPIYQLTVLEAWLPSPRATAPSEFNIHLSDSQGSPTNRIQGQPSETDGVKGNPLEGNPDKEIHKHRQVANELPQTVEEAVEVAKQLGIEAEFASHEFHAKKAVGWKDGYGNPIISWPDQLQARWPIEQRKRTERRATSRTAAKRQSPPRQFHSSDYNQPKTNF